MSSPVHVFAGVTLALLERLHAAGDSDYALQLDPDRRGGTVRRPTPLGEVVVRFAHDPARATMTVTILHKPRLVPAAVVWSGVARALQRGAAHPSGRTG